MTSLSDDNQADVIDAFNSTFRYLDDLLNIDTSYFEGMVNQINPPELQLNKASTSDTELSSGAWSTGAQLMVYFCFRLPVVLFDRPGISICHATRCIC